MSVVELYEAGEEVSRRHLLFGASNRTSSSFRPPQLEVPENCPLTPISLRTSWRAKGDLKHLRIKPADAIAGVIAMPCVFWLLPPGPPTLT